MKLLYAKKMTCKTRGVVRQAKLVISSKVKVLVW